MRQGRCRSVPLPEPAARFVWSKSKLLKCPHFLWRSARRRRCTIPSARGQWKNAQVLCS